MNDIRDSRELPDFSLVLGGPLYQLLVRSRLATPVLDRVKRRVIVISMFAWLPLLILSLLSGTAWGGVGLPFLRDIEMQTRFLAVLPLLIGGELLVHQRLRLIVGPFVDRNIITEAVLPRFRDVIASAMKLRNSVAIELILFILIYFGGYYLWNSISGMAKIEEGAGTWFAIPTASGTRLSPSGYWYVFASRPLFQFVLFRWYLRLFIWSRLLWQTSRLELNLIPTHPDRAAGLGFLGVSSAAFAPLLLAHGALLAGLMANPILIAGAKLTDFKMEIVGAVLFLLLLVFGPLLAFSPRLMQAKRNGQPE
jgi:hypothetical protein